MVPTNTFSTHILCSFVGEYVMRKFSLLLSVRVDILVAFCLCAALLSVAEGLEATLDSSREMSGKALDEIDAIRLSHPREF
jgi:hypothetical protein